MSKTFKRVTYSISAVILAPIILFFIVFGANPLKVTDPYHPWFDIDNFRFEDYWGSPCMQKSDLAKLFPVGTDKQFVDRVLVKAGGATVFKSQNKENKYNYTYKIKSVANYFFGFGLWNIASYYDDKGKLVSMSLAGDIDDQNIYTHYRDCKVGIDYGRDWK